MALTPIEHEIFDNCDAIDKKIIDRIDSAVTVTEAEQLQREILVKSIEARKYLRKRKGSYPKAQGIQSEIQKMNERLTYILLMDQNDRAA